MTTIRRLSLILNAILILAGPAVAARDLDLAAVGSGSTRTLRVEPGETLDLRIIHRLPGKAYSVEVVIDDLPMGAFTLTGFRSPSRSDSPALTTTPSTAGCTKAIEGAFALDDEAKLPGLLAANPQCADMIKRLTSEAIEPSFLERGQRLKIVITREARVWTWIFSTGPRGEWRTSYGFTFVPNEDRKYLTRPGAGDESAKFRIFEQDDREELDFVPSVLFSWRPATHEPGRGWSLAGGLGWDLERPVVLAGAAWTFNDNLILTFGVAIHQQTRLLGKYSKEPDDPGNLVGEALEPGQLVESTYGPNLYLGVAFRFDTNSDPFKRSVALQKEAAAAEQARLKQVAAAAAAKAEAEERLATCKAVAAAEFEVAVDVCGKNLTPAEKTTCELEAKRALALAEQKCLADD